MARKQRSELSELLTLLRRIVILSVAVIGLAREMPYLTLAVRLAVLWGILYVAGGALEALFSRLHYQARLREDKETGSKDTTLPAAVQSESN